jgi:hypothetical protein
LAGCKGGEEVPTPVPESTFGALEREILGPKCAAQSGCHAGPEPAGKLDLSPGKAFGNLVAVRAERRPELFRVAPGDPEGSYLLQRLSAGGDTPRMPLGAAELPAAELERIRAWIREGGKK